MFKEFLRNRSGAYAIMVAVVSVPLLLGVGLAVDYARLSQASSHLQELADGASLTLAASRETNKDKLKVMADDFVKANAEPKTFGSVAVEALDLADKDEVGVTLKGNVPMTFMSLANIHSMDVSSFARAVRGVNGSLEVSLILDNTFSMSETDAKGMSKLDTAKAAAENLVNKLTENPDAQVRFALVPFADYVNVGKQHRNASWMDVEADKQTGSPRECKPGKVTKSQCTAYEPTYTCTEVVDGVVVKKTCGGGCKPGATTSWQEDGQVCTGGYTNHTWFGCVASRKIGATRLHDGEPSVRYPGHVSTWQQCPTPIIALTKDKAMVIKGIKGMKHSNGGYRPKTYIPSGLIWGLNTLSPAEPFNEGLAYDSKNIAPRKVAVLMTDGENTMFYNAEPGKDSKDGKHKDAAVNADGTLTPDGATKVARTNSDTLAICDNMKAHAIEVFSIAFRVDDAVARNMLEKCSSSALGTTDHYYDATSSEQLIAAFGEIAQKLTKVRLAQ